MASEGYPDFKSEQIKYKSFAAQIVDQIDEMIAMGHLSPGDLLPPERELAKRFGVSRPTINEALSALESQGVVVRKIGSGTYINQEIPEAVLSKCLERFVLFHSCTDEELVVFREALEPEIAALAAVRATSEDIKRLEQDLITIEKTIEENPDLQTEPDLDFHLTLAQASKNKLFISVIEGIKGRIESWIHTSKMRNMEKGLTLHREVYNAIVSHNPKAARKAMLDHMKMNRDIVGLSNGHNRVNERVAKDL